MRGKRVLTAEDEATLLRLDDLRYALRDKNLALAFGIPEASLRWTLCRLRRERREQAEEEFKQIRRSDTAATGAT